MIHSRPFDAAITPCNTVIDVFICNDLRRRCGRSPTRHRDASRSTGGSAHGTVAASPMEIHEMPKIRTGCSGRMGARIALLLLGSGLGVTALAADPDACAPLRPNAASPPPKAAAPAASKADLSGAKRVGVASFYAPKFAGRKMADGQRMNPNDDNAASKTLPLGTTAKVTNLETGRSATVTIQDRGPYVKGRIVDLSPSTAQQIGITRDDGIAKVEVAPIQVPMPDGTVKPGAAKLASAKDCATPDKGE